MPRLYVTLTHIFDCELWISINCPFQFLCKQLMLVKYLSAKDVPRATGMFKRFVNAFSSIKNLCIMNLNIPIEIGSAN